MNTPDLYNLFLKNPEICIDSRKANKGSLFFALKGPNFDGNRYAKQALETCSFAIVDNPEVVDGERFILVDDVLLKLQRLAAYHRKRLGTPIIAITGTNGKTTTKELIAAVMSKKYKVAFTQGNLNNHIGVPLTLLSMTKEHKFGVIEMGANHQGEIALLCKIAAPDFGIITNVGKAHLEGFGSFEGVKKAKGELYRYLYENDGTAFVNYDNEHLEDMNPPHNVIYYGTNDFTHCQGQMLAANPFLSLKWLTLDELSADDDLDDSSRTIQTQLVGDYNFENALAAVCIGDSFNVIPQDIKEAIEAYKPNNNRSQLCKTTSNTLLLDCYNANPTSMRKAIEGFHKQMQTNQVYILGDMLELGEASIREHGAIIGFLQELNITDAFLIGPFFSNYSEIDTYKYFDSVESLKVYLKENLLQNKQILIKGSRGIKLEEIVDFL
jgi:UDP-N-acetylmuramoyl-tripeptide--D-alanyl-D-alanine ligase